MSDGQDGIALHSFSMTEYQDQIRSILNHLSTELFELWQHANNVQRLADWAVSMKIPDSVVATLETLTDDFNSPMDSIGFASRENMLDNREFGKP